MAAYCHAGSGSGRSFSHGEHQTMLVIAMLLQGAGMGLPVPPLAVHQWPLMQRSKGCCWCRGLLRAVGVTIGPLLGLLPDSTRLPYWFTFALYLPLIVFVLRTATE